jgi:hypothetical protein
MVSAGLAFLDTSRPNSLAIAFTFAVDRGTPPESTAAIRLSACFTYSGTSTASIVGAACCSAARLCAFAFLTKSSSKYKNIKL